MLTRLLTAATLLGLAATAFAQPPVQHWPTRTLRIVVPAPPGGPYDRSIRPLAQHMARTLGQPIVIDNRPGAGNIIGTQAGASAAPDGYTLTMTGLQNAIAASVYDKVPFDIVEDFAHVGAIGEGPQWLVVRTGAGIASFADLLAQARQAPGRIDYASSGAGSTGHLLMEQLQRSADITLTHVPYKGGAPALQDVLGGVVAVIVVPSNAAMAPVQAGQLQVLAVSSRVRSPLVPQVPTFAELGLPQLTVSAWVGLSAPRGTPAPIVRKLNAALHAALRDPAIARQMDTEGLTALPDTPAHYTQLVRDDTARFGELVRSLNLKAN
ncbi:hypothetical protein ASF43_07815 [Pseudorhodoferax sp. Leaf267]|nr:hypothetical protein ASF43_07815 [Pseudorhodoferax sp. Leaf267]